MESIPAQQLILGTIMGAVVRHHSRAQGLRRGAIRSVGRNALAERVVTPVVLRNAHLHVRVIQWSNRSIVVPKGVSGQRRNATRSVKMSRNVIKSRVRSNVAIVRATTCGVYPKTSSSFRALYFETQVTP